jgi:3'-phosphoadenosine 5'-phosphosulfate sulfotransferase (PAPS reductase)/FAD synthetase
MRPEEFVRRYRLDHLVCSFSGGRDSLVATHYTLSRLDGEKAERHVVWVDTTVTIPEVRRFVRRVAREFGWPLVELRPEGDFEEYALRFGTPTMRRRWCCYYLKLRPIFRYLRGLEGRVGEVLGMRREESRRRERYPEVWRRPQGSWVYSPILRWTEEEVEEYMEENGLPTPPWYGKGIRETCQCGAFASLSRMRKVCKLYPEFFQRFVELEKEFRNGGACFFLEGRPYYAREIWEEVWGKKGRRASG